MHNIHLNGINSCVCYWNGTFHVFRLVYLVWFLWKKKVLKHPHFSLLSYISISFLYFLLKTVCLRSRCQIVKVTLQMQMTTLVAMATQHPDLKLFTVVLPWWRCLLPFSGHRQQIAWQFLLPPPNTTSHPSLQWVHLQWAVDPCSRQPSLRCRTRAQREPSFHPWRLSRSAYKVLHWADDKRTDWCCAVSLAA